MTGAPQEPRAAPIRIIVVEDERIVALHLKQQLTRLGYDVVALAASGEQALAEILALRPDLVLMDIHIEGALDGIEVAARIPGALGIPVVYVSAYSEQAALARARSTKPYGYLVKPFSEKEMHATIQMALERREVYGALEASKRELEAANQQLQIKIEEAARSERDLRQSNRQLIEASAQRAESEAEFRAAFEGSMLGKAMVDPLSRRILRANRALAHMLGYEPEELIGRTGAEFTWPEDRAPITAEYARLVAGEADSFVGEKRYVRRDGAPFWARVSAAVVRNAQGDRPPFVVSTFEDIDARHRADDELRIVNTMLTQALADRGDAEEALVRSEAEFRASFEGSVVGKVVVEPASRRILRANRAFAHMLGYEPEELAGRPGADVIWPADRDSNAQGWARLLSGEAESYLDEKRYIRRDGTPFWVRVSAALVRAPRSDRSMLAVATVEDIDTRHKAEQALLAANRDLEALVEERTGALKQRDLLLREVYHRVNNNLQIVDSLLAAQARKSDDLEARAVLLGLRGRVFALGLIHHQLMGSGDLRTFDVAPFLHELSRNILEGLGTSGVNLVVDACTLKVGLDFAVPFGLLTTELVTNSLMHGCRNGIGEIVVVLREQADGDLVLVVSDDGPGRPADGAAVRSGGVGTGIINSLVAQLEATMTVRTDEGTRTEVRMAVPASP
ncbi:MAG: PAS domain S-box protein [Roseiarcus sp.]